MKHKLLNSGDITMYALIFDSGEEVMQGLKTFANEHKLSSARFTAIGAFQKAQLGFFDFEIKDYKKIEVSDQVEVLSLMGDVALYGDESKVHAHVVLGKFDGNAVGGHLMNAIVHPTLEVILEETPSYLQRRMDKETGLPLIVID
jgi:uncharacterized protein